MNSKAVWQSLALHFFGIVVLVFFVWAAPKSTRKNQLKFKVIEKPIEQSVWTPSAAQPPQPKAQAAPEKQKPAQKVFGLNNKTLTQDSNASAVTVKSGNTIAKENDDLKMDPKDANSLPVEEFLITRMPQVRKEVRAAYPLEAKKSGVTGDVILEIIINRQGRVISATVIQGLDYGLDEAALSAIRQFEFSPAEVDGQPVPIKTKYTYRFQLD